MTKNDVLTQALNTIDQTEKEYYALLYRKDKVMQFGNYQDYVAIDRKLAALATRVANARTYYNDIRNKG